MNIGIIGTGGRATVYVKWCLSGIREALHIKALADINEEKLHKYAQEFFKEADMPEFYTDYNKLLQDKEIEAVFICTSDFTHREIAIAALKAGKHVFLEKPMATTIEDCMEIYRESLRHNKVFRLGFVLRYTNVYTKVKEIVSKGELGQLISIEAKEMLGYKHGASFFRRWHRLKKNNGGFLNAKCSHDLDIMNWIAGSKPLYVSAFGSRSYFNPKENAAQKCSECRLKTNCRYFVNSEGNSVFERIDESCVFNVEKDIVDHEVVNIGYENGVTASFTVSMLSAEANRTMVVFGSEATMYVDFAKGMIKVKYIFPESEAAYFFGDISSGHGGGDKGVFENFIDSIKEKHNTNINDAWIGMVSSVLAISAEISMDEKRVVDLRNMALEINHK